MHLYLSRYQQLVFALFISISTSAQVGINTNTPHASAMLDINASNKGVLMPRAWLFNIDSSAPIDSYRDWQTDWTSYSLLVYNYNPIIQNGLTGEGYYWWNGYKWNKLNDVGISWKTNGNIGSPTLKLGALDFIGVEFRRNGLTAGLFSYNNTIFGAGNNRTYTSSSNVAFGAESFLAPKFQNYNNVAFGAYAMSVDSAGPYNVSIGAGSMAAKKKGESNTALGYNALYNNQGSYNTAIGAHALYTNVNGSYNTGIGYATSALSNLFFAAAIGAEAGVNCNNCMALGGTGAAAVKVGIGTASPTADLDIIQQSDSFGIRLKSTEASTGWFTYADNSGNYAFERLALECYIQGSNGQLITVSDSTAKKNIKLMSPALSQVMRLQPKSYRYKHAPLNARTFGLIAQDVEKLFPELVETSGNGYKAINYSGFGVIAIKTIQEQQAFMNKQDALIDAMQKRIIALENNSR